MRVLLVILFAALLLPQVVLANARDALEKVNNPRFSTGREQALPDVKAIRKNENILKDIKLDEIKTKVELNTIAPEKTSGMTNYQYDENNLHYYKFQKYIQDNLNYSQSGKSKY